MAEAAIRTEKLTKVFGRGGNRLTAVDGLNLKVQKGEVFGFLGPNGAGKTSTIRMVTGIAYPTAGRVFINGVEMTPSEQDAKRSIGFMPEIPGYYATLSALDHLVFWADFYRIPRGEARARALDLLNQVGLAETAKRKAKSFSHGMKKRLALAGALISDPDVLVLDEPSGGLDPEGTIFFRRLIDEQKKKGKTIFLSSHLLPEVQMICTRVGILNRGRIVALDTVEDLAKKVMAKAPFRLQVDCPPLTPQQAAAVMAVRGVMAVQPTPTGLFVTAAPGFPVGFEVNHALVSAGVRVSALVPLIPTLEEVFLELIKEGGGAS